jgi:receptor protein-tyrosine kinase
MTGAPDSRPHLVERLQQARANDTGTHLVERALAALGGPDAATTAPAAPPPSPAEAPPAPRPAITTATLIAAGLVAPADGPRRDRVLEEVAVVQTQLLRAMPRKPASEGRTTNVVLFTSARPGEGKTFCSLNIAAGLARASTRPVILVDADGKAGSLTAALGQADSSGLMGLVADPGLPPAQFVLPTELARLSVLPYGAPSAREGQPPGPRVAAALLRVAAAMPQHIIVVDAPPCLAASDPSTLAPIAAQVVIVVQAERTERREVEAALDMVDSCPTLHLLLNQARLTASDSFGAYGGYDGYGGGTGGE